MWKLALATPTVVLASAAEHTAHPIAHTTALAAREWRTHTHQVGQTCFREGSAHVNNW